MARILIVDDEEVVRNVVRSYLRSSGHTLAEAVDGEDALAVHRLQPADLVVTDNHMPGWVGPNWSNGFAGKARIQRSS